MATKKNYKGAAQEYFAANDPTDFIKGRYGLGISFLRLDLPHLASIPIMTVAIEGDGKMQKRALDKLVRISYDINDTSILNYSIKKLKPEDLEDTSLEVYQNQLSEYLIEKNELEEALKTTNEILKKNNENERALFLSGLIYLKKNEPQKASEYFKFLSNLYEKKSPKNTTRGLALANYARALYQDRDFVGAESLYRKIPKDHAIYRKVQIELTWTLFRMGKIRSALSILQTLHTPYYENFYDPESFILRAIILLFACQGDEAFKATESFENSFKGVEDKLALWNSKPQAAENVMNEITLAEQIKSSLANKADSKMNLPFFVVRTLMDEEPLRGLLQAKQNIIKEKQQFIKKFSDVSGLPLYHYAMKAYTAKVKSTDTNIVSVFNKKIKETLKNFRELESQVDFLKYEILEERKRASKEKISGPTRVDDNRVRSFYTQNGYRYWPFNGEYWIDEIGNYQYLGVNRCEH